MMMKLGSCGVRTFIPKCLSVSTRQTTTGRSLGDNFFKLNVKEDSTLLGIGIFAGTLGSLVGLGGAFVIIPILTGPVGMSAHSAIGTSMAAVLATSAGSVSSYATHRLAGKSEKELEDTSSINRQVSSETITNTIFNTSIPRVVGCIDIAAVLCLVSTAAICAPLGARFSKHVRDLYIRRAQGVLMLFAGASFSVRDLVFQRPVDTPILIEVADKKFMAPQEGFANIAVPIGQDAIPETISSAREKERLSPLEALKLCGIGVFSGFVAGFFGVGGGAVVVPALALVMDFDHKTALGTSMAAMLPTALSGAAVHFMQGTMLVRQAIPLSIGCLVGSLGGGKLSRYINDTYLRNLFSGTIFSLGIRAVFKSW